MSTHNIAFYEDIRKITPYLSSNKHLISSAILEPVAVTLAVTFYHK